MSAAEANVRWLNAVNARTEVALNRKQTVTLGVICLGLAFGSFIEGSQFGGVWSFLLTAAYPLLITGLFVVFALRERETSPGIATPVRWYLAALAGAVVLLLGTLLVLVG